MQVLRDQSYLAISPSKQKVTLLRNLTKEKHRNLAFVQQMTVLEQKKALHKKRVQLSQDWFGHQHGRRFIVLGHHYGPRDVM